MYTFVSVEDSNSKPLEQGLRGLFMQKAPNEDVQGWVLDASHWTFQTFSIPSDQFVPSNAPYLLG